MIKYFLKMIGILLVLVVLGLTAGCGSGDSGGGTVTPSGGISGSAK